VRIVEFGMHGPTGVTGEEIELLPPSQGDCGRIWFEDNGDAIDGCEEDGCEEAAVSKESEVVAGVTRFGCVSASGSTASTGGSSNTSPALIGSLGTSSADSIPLTT
jgi:hypothetical protein